MTTKMTAGAKGDLPDLRYEHLRGHLIGDDGPESTDSGIDTLVAYDGDQPVGHISWMTREGWTKGAVDALGVDDAYRRRGIATELLRRARQIEPEVNPRNTPWFTDDGEAWVNTVSSKTAGPADDYIPGHMRGPTRVAPTEMPMPRPVVVDRPAEEDLETLPPSMRQKVVDAVRDIEDGSAPLEAKERELAGVYTMRLSNAWRAAFYMGREGFWHLMYVGPHDYTEVAKRWTRTSVRKTSATHTVTTGDYQGISFEYHEKYRGENGQEYLLIREPTSITARTPDGRTAGYLTVVVSTNEIGAVNVVSQHRRQGLATAMLRMAREQFPGLAHTTVPGQLSPDGEAWARVVGSSLREADFTPAR